MFAVIFKATIKAIDNEYYQLASQLRDLALSQYNCQEFTAVSEGDQEIAISYWKSQEDILRWKQDTLHIKAQQLGKEKWYRAYSVEIVSVEHRYQSP